MPRNKTNLFRTMSEARSDYDAAKNSQYTPRLSGVTSVGTGADYHYRSDREYIQIIERARHLCRNDLIAGAALDRLSTNVLMDGFSCDPQTGDKAIDADLKAAWKEWSEDPDQCHSEGEFTFRQIEQMVFTSMIRDGDVFVLPLKSGSLQCIEAHRVRTASNTTKDVVHGILLDSNARRTEIWVTKEDLGLSYRAVKRVSDVKQYPVRDAQGNRQVLQIYAPDRFSQRRGVSAFAPAINPLGMHDDIQFAALVKQQIGALICLIREQSAGGPEGVPSTPLGAVTESTDRDGFITELESLAAGLDITGRPGEKLEMFSPNVPGPQFFEHSYLVLSFVAARLGIPVAVLLLDPQKSGSFSAWRGAIDQARSKFRKMQSDFKGQFHSPVYHWFVRRLLIQDPVLRAAAERSDVHIFGHRFNAPQWPYIEPMRDAQADALQVEALLNSPRRIQAARGRDIDDVHREIVEDNKQLIELALEAAADIQSRYPDSGVTWREMLSLSQKDRSTAMSVLGKDDPSDPEQN